MEKDKMDVVSGGRRGKKVFIVFVALFCLALSAFYSHSQQPSQQKQAQPQTTPQNAQPSQKSLEEERMNILKADIQKEIEDYKKLKKEYEGIQKAQDDKKQESMAKIAKIFEAMPTDEAAKKLEKLDEDTAVLILNSLKPKSAGKILALIEDSKAASISKKILIKARVLQEKNSD